MLLDRLDDSHTGADQARRSSRPRSRSSASLQAERTAQVIGDEVWSKFPLQPGVEPVTKNNTELILNRTWRPGLAITGADGWPPIGNAGNVLRPSHRR